MSQDCAGVDTFKGVDFFWPAQGRVGLPHGYCIKNNTWSEYFFVYGMMLAVGCLIGGNLFGL